MITSTLVAFAVLVAVVILTSTVVKIPAPYGLFLSSIAAGLVAGVGLPVSRMVEGSFGFFYIILTFGSGLILVKVMEGIGFNDHVQKLLLTRLARRRGVLYLSLMFLLMVPGMLTGIGSVAVVSTGAVVTAVLLGMGAPKTWTAVFVMTGAILGMIAPPVNLPLMYIGVLIALPYEGFGPILLLLTIPIAIVTALWIGFRFGSTERLEERARIITEKDSGTALYAYLPIVTVLFLLIAERMIPVWPELALPLVLMIGALVGLPKLGFRKFFAASTDALKGQAFLILMIIVTAGIKGEFLSLSGVRGLLATFFFAMVPAGLLIPSLIGMPLLGAFGTVFGATFILGFPFVLALLPRSSIITAAALSLIAAVADIMPPTALSGNLAMNLVGLDRYRSIFYRALLPAGGMIALGMAAIAFADLLAGFLT